MNEPSENDPAATFLARFQPTPVREELMQRLLAARPVALETPPAPRPVLIRLFPHILKAAAVFVVTGVVAWYLMPHDSGTVHPQTAGTPEASPTLRPAPHESNQQLLGVRDIGITHDAQRRPVRLMQATWLDDRVYTGRDGNQALREASVREEILPVVLTTY